MVETDMKPINEDVEVLNGLQVLTANELTSASKRATNFREALTSLLDIPVDRDQLVELVQNENVPDNPTMGDYLAGAMIMKAAMGDTKAYEVIRDTMGQKPVDRVEQDTVMRVVMDANIQEYGK